MGIKIQNILVVEDEAIIGMALAADLEDMGYDKVVLAGSGEEALGLINQETFDLVLMDIQLGGEIDGIETLKNIRKVANPRVVFITGNSEKGTIIKLQGQDADGFLVKPINIKDLQVLLDTMQF